VNSVLGDDIEVNSVLGDDIEVNSVLGDDIEVNSVLGDDIEVGENVFTHGDFFLLLSGLFSANHLATGLQCVELIYLTESIK